MTTLNRRTFLGLSAAAATGAVADSRALALPLSAGAAAGAEVSSPPLGWNSFDSHGFYLDESAALSNLAAAAERLLPHGFEFFVIDLGWYGEYRLVPGTLYPAEKWPSDIRLDEFGVYQPSRTYFPNGLAPILQAAEKLGMRVGLHLMRGISRKAVELDLPIRGTRYSAREIADLESPSRWCPYTVGVDMDHPGAQAWYNHLIDELAGWGVEFLKVDDIVEYPRELLAVAEAVDRCRRRLVLSLSPGQRARLRDLAYYRRATMVRTTADIWDRRRDLDRAFEAWLEFQGASCCGFWPDLDMIPFGELQVRVPELIAGRRNPIEMGGGFRRRCRLTRAQQRTFMTQRALAASPLFVGGEVTTMDDYSLGLLTNGEMLRCNQNGVTGVRVDAGDGFEVWLAPHREDPRGGWLGVFNRSGSEKVLPFSRDWLGAAPGACRLHDVWSGQPVAGSGPDPSLTLDADDVVFLRFEKDRA